MPLIYKHSVLDAEVTRLDVETTLADGQSIQWGLAIPFGLAAEIQDMIGTATVNQAAGEIRVQAKLGSILKKLLAAGGHTWDVVTEAGDPMPYSQERAMRIIEHHPHIGFEITQAVLEHVLSKKQIPSGSPSPGESFGESIEGPFPSASDSTP
jgi:hypothetical protein